MTTCDGVRHEISEKWDLIIAHPPCTYLTVSANKYYVEEKYGEKAVQRKKNREEAKEFFMQFINADCEHIAVENPIGVMSTAYRKPDQIIQPFYFGDRERKATCLWLKNLPNLISTDIVEPIIVYHSNGRTDGNLHYQTLSLPSTERSRIRSKTFPGIAKAMAEQWGRGLK